MAVQVNEDIIRALLKRQDPEEHWGEDLRAPFTWQGGAGQKRKAGDRDQKVTNKLIANGIDTSPVGHWTQGAARVASALAGVYRENKHYDALAAAERQAQLIRNTEVNAMTEPAAPQQAPQAPQSPPSPFAPPPNIQQTPFAPPPTGETGPGFNEAPPSEVVQPSISISEQQAAPMMQNVSATIPTAPDGDMGPHQRALLNTIAGPESAGKYDVIYGGSRFNNFADHPRQHVRIQSGPNAGLTSTAAGKYQFLSNTWDTYKNKLGLQDFTPQSQDRAALALAADVYKQRTGQDINAVLQSGDPQAIANVGRVLSGTWTSLPGGIEQGINQNRFVSAYQRNLGQGAQNPATARIVQALMAPREIPAGMPGAINQGQDAASNIASLLSGPSQPAALNQPQAAPNEQQTPQSQGPVYMLGNSHAAPLAKFANAKSLGVDGASLARSITQLYKVPNGSTVYMMAGDNDAGAAESVVRVQMQEAGRIAKEKGINLIWTGPLGAKAQPLDTVMADAAAQNGFQYRSMRGNQFAMQPDGVHAQINPQGYGAMWNALQQQPQATAQPTQLASLGNDINPAILASLGVGPNAQQAEQPPQQPQGPQLAQSGPIDLSTIGAAPRGILTLPQQPMQPPPQTRAQQEQQVPQQPREEPLPAAVRRNLAHPDPAVRAVAKTQYEKWLQRQNEKPQYGVIGKDPYGREVYGWIDPRTRATTPNAQFAPEQGPTSEQAAKLRNEIRDLPSYKNMAVVGPAYNRMVKSAGNDNRAADLSLVYTFMKMLDPGSVVRESEVSMAQGVPTLPQQYQNQIQSFLTGKGRLDPAVRQQLVQEAKIAAQSYRSAWDNDLKLYRGIVGRQKFNEADIYQDFEPFQDFTPPPPAALPPIQDIERELKNRGVQ